MVSICRLCASLKKTENLTFLRENNQDLCQKLFKCCQLSIDLKDVLPKGVCPECIRCLNTSFEFYERVHESQQSLEKLLNVDSSSKSSNDMVIDEEASVDERNSLALVAASIESDELAEEPPRDSNDIDETLVADENDDSDDVARVINQILGVKNEEGSYVVIDSDNEETAAKPEEASEKDGDEVPHSHESVLLTSNYAGIEFIEEDQEEIDFDSNRYEIIEEEEDEGGDDPAADDSSQFELVIEDNVAPDEEEYNKPSTALPLSTDTWTDYNWKCVRCSVTCTSSKHLIEHNEKVHQVKGIDIQWYCADCQKRYTRYYTLINHIRQRHRTNLALFCDICNERCESFKNLEQHRREFHADEDIPVMFLCVTCGKGFYTSNSLQIHRKCHLPDDQRLRYACTLCDKKFRTSSNLKFHQKMHLGTRDYVCDQCGKNFVQRANLEEHLVTHISCTPYMCTVCDKLFKTPERLTRHKQRHTDEKPFVCTECDKTFRTKDAMNTHKRIHTGEMPFACEFCQKPFRFRSTLMTHHNVHTGTRPYSCNDCNHHFTNWPNYNKHMKRRHGIDVSSKNPRGKKPANPPKPPPKPTKPKPTTIVSKYIVKHQANNDIRLEPANDNIDAEYEPEEDINITLPKQERASPDDNYVDAN